MLNDILSNVVNKEQWKKAMERKEENRFGLRALEFAQRRGWGI
jgi:hypothetical protein